MYYSKMFIPTLKNSPADAEVVSHKLMVRAGMSAFGRSELFDFNLRLTGNIRALIYLS